MPFISSPYRTASPFSGISHDNIPASLRDVHRTYICGGFLWDTHRSIGDGFCVMCTELSAMVCVWCTRMSVTVCVWCAQIYQRWFVCDAHRSIRDGLCVMCTELSVMVCVWCAQIYQRWFVCDVHRTICDGVCVMCTDLSEMVCVWCTQIYQWWFLCDMHRTISDGFCVMHTDLSLYQWWFLCDLHRNISDGLHGMHTDLSVMVCMWCAQIYQLGWQPTFHQLSLPTLPPHPLPLPHLTASPSFLRDSTLQHTWWFVRDAHSTISCVHVLSPSPCCPKRVNLKVLGVHTDVYLQNNLLPYFSWYYFWHVYSEDTLHKTTLLIHCRN